MGMRREVERSKGREKKGRIDKHEETDTPGRANTVRSTPHPPPPLSLFLPLHPYGSTVLVALCAVWSEVLSLHCSGLVLVGSSLGGMAIR